MKIAVLAKPDTWHFRDLVRAAGRDFDLSAIDYCSINATVAAGETRVFGHTFKGGNVDLAGFDALIIRAMPAGSLEQVVFRMDLLGTLAAKGVPVINSPRTIEAAVDKFLSLALIQNAGVPVPATTVCQTRKDALRAFESLNHDAVVKPLFGSQGRGIVRVRSLAQAVSTFDDMLVADRVIYLQEFIEHGGSDLRVMVIGNETFGMRRVNHDNWITNASQGATCSRGDVTGEEHRLALQAARAVGANYAGVDIVRDGNGNAMVVEINACPGWRAFNGATGIDVARKLLESAAEISEARSTILQR